MLNQVDWETVANWWSSLSTVVQIGLALLTLYTTGNGSGRLLYQCFRVARWGVGTTRAWYQRPSRMAMLEARMDNILGALGVVEPTDQDGL